jgi:hypothetical protein
MKLVQVVDALSKGAVLHLSLADKPTWKLNNGVTEVTVNSRAAKSLFERGIISGNGDSLFPEIPAQTWRLRRTAGAAKRAMRDAAIVRDVRAGKKRLNTKYQLTYTRIQQVVKRAGDSLSLSLRNTD